MQRLQRNFKTDGVRNFMYTKHNGDNAKSITKYTTQFYQSYIPNNQLNKHNPNNQNSDINVAFTTNTKFSLLQLGQCNFWSINI